MCFLQLSIGYFSVKRFQLSKEIPFIYPRMYLKTKNSVSFSDSLPQACNHFLRKLIERSASLSGIIYLYAMWYSSLLNKSIAATLQISRSPGKNLKLSYMYDIFIKLYSFSSLLTNQILLFPFERSEKRERNWPKKIYQIVTI